MKEAFWGYGMFILFIFGLFIFWATNQSTVYNQQDYLYMKGQVEASMKDAIDWQAFKQGFYVCSNKCNSSGKCSFKDSSDYVILTCGGGSSGGPGDNSVTSDKLCDEDGNLMSISEITDKYGDSNPLTRYGKCEGVVAEYKIDRNLFTTTLTNRLANILKKGLEYDVEVTEIVEYPPRVHVKVGYKQEVRNSLENQDEVLDVINEMDAIIEDNGTVTFMKNN